MYMCYRCILYVCCVQRCNLWSNLESNFFKKMLEVSLKFQPLPPFHLSRQMPRRRKWQPTPVFLLGKTLWTEKPSRLQSMMLQRVWHDWATEHTSKCIPQHTIISSPHQNYKYYAVCSHFIRILLRQKCKMHSEAGLTSNT